MDRYQPRFNSQGQFRPATGPPQFGRFDYRGTFQGPVPRPMPIYPHESHLGEFRPVYNHSLDPRGGFLCPPRARQSFHHEGKYEEFTPPRPFHGWNKGHRQNSSISMRHGGPQRPEFKVSFVEKYRLVDFM